MAAKRKRRNDEDAAELHREGRPKKRRKKSSKKRSKSKKKKRSATVKKHRSSGGVSKTSKRRKGGRRRGTATGEARRGTIPVEGLIGSGTSGGRYPGPAKSIEQFVTRTWRPDPNQDLNKADIIHFSMRVRKGQIIR